MNTFTYENLKISHTESFTQIIGVHHLNTFVDITQDTNPIHTDIKYATERGFEDRVVHGMLTASFYSTLVGVYLPGKYCFLQECNASFHYPVYIGDTLTIEGRIMELNEVLNRITISAKITNQHNKRVSKATIYVGILI